MFIVKMVMVMTLLEPLMMDDFDGALEMDADGPLMEIAYGDGQLQPLMEPMMM